MPGFFRNLSAFVKRARACIRAYSDAPPDEPTQHIKQKYARLFMDDAGIEYEGPSPEVIAALPPGIFVANHASMVDALLICAFFGTDVRILAKEKLFRAPYVGPVLRRENHIRVCRGKNARDRNLQVRADIRNALSQGASIFMFPEGTRTPDGAVHEFKLGAFFNALQNKVPVIPVSIGGTFEVMPKTGLSIRPGKCRLEILSPIFPPPDADGDSRDDALALANLARTAIENALREAKK